MKIYRSSITSGIILVACLASAGTSCKSNNGATPSADTLMMDTVAETSGPLTLEDSISQALDYQLTNYPSSQYRDIYKNFMQDFFGPGHLLNDTAASGKYLRKELAEDSAFEGPLFEKTGYKGNFYRVNLSLVRDGVVPYDVFFTNFVKSVQNIIPPSANEWRNTWDKIDKVIKEKGLHFPDEKADRNELIKQLENNDFVVHHSQRFNDSVHFHYRIISSELFEKEILPLVNKGK